MFQHVLVPGLFQTPEYARAVLAKKPHTTEDELETCLRPGWPGWPGRRY
jgi:hypothetical protein